MPALVKAELRQLDANFQKEINDASATVVQFNPDSLKVSFANQIATPSGSGDQNGPQARQFVGAGTTKLAVTLYFDVTSELPPGLPQVDDVRKLTQRVAYFITPAGEPANQPTKFIPPAVRFIWGSFIFDGIMESLEETLDFFSPGGQPLRATVAIGLSQQKITAFQFKDVPPPPAATLQGGQPAGTAPFSEAPAGASLQSMVANQPGLGPGADWQSIALANGIENPRLLQPGQLINLTPSSASASIQIG